jgi:hypothetical protein
MCREEHRLRPFEIRVFRSKREREREREEVTEE